MTLKFTNKESAILKNYLIQHEFDIANDINDFGDMEPIFNKVVGRNPNEMADDLTIESYFAKTRKTNGA